MEFFEQELRKIMENSRILKDQKYAGRKYYGTVDGDMRACIEFVSLGVKDEYAGIKATLINRKEGPIDSMVLRFADLFGKKKVSNPNFKDGIVPHIWKDGMNHDWYVYHPSAQDYEAMARKIEDYLSVFQEEAMEQTAGMQQMT